jgi:hypothetical protein
MRGRFVLIVVPRRSGQEGVPVDGKLVEKCHVTKATSVQEGPSEPSEPWSVHDRQDPNNKFAVGEGAVEHAGERRV